MYIAHSSGKLHESYAKALIHQRYRLQTRVAITKEDVANLNASNDKYGDASQSEPTTRTRVWLALSRSRDI